MQPTEIISKSLSHVAKSHTLPIERLVWSGGGAKGVVYSGSYKALEVTGLLPHIKEIAGASAGAITAAFIAIGMPTTIFRDTLLHTNLKTLLGKRVGSGLRSNSPGISFITKDGDILEKFLRHNIRTSVKTFLDNLDGNDQSICASLIAKFQNEKPHFTFADLNFLHQNYPSRFKKLTVPAVTFPTGDVQIFNCTYTPDVEVALACRASASIPIVLKPVEIEVNGKRQLYVDGGLFDNLPSEYFDLDPSSNETKNTKPLQTLIFAFNEGLKKQKNPVFNALYGTRIDEIIATYSAEIQQQAHAFQPPTLEHSTNLEKLRAEANILLHAVCITIQKHHAKNLISPTFAQNIISTCQQGLSNILDNIKAHQTFFLSFIHEQNYNLRVKLLTDKLMQALQPILFHATAKERLKRNVLVKFLGDMKTSYKNTDRKEIGYQKLRSIYPLRTIELNVGKIKSTDFNQATKLARVADAFGYLDTINYIAIHDLYDANLFDIQKFYTQLLDNFDHIYRSILVGALKTPSHDNFIQKIIFTKAQLYGASTENINREIYYLIKDTAEQNLLSPIAFALTRAVEFQNKTITSDELFKEVFLEGFKNSPILSATHISGERIISSTTLSKTLRYKSMFAVCSSQPQHTHATRCDRILAILSQMHSFVSCSVSTTFVQQEHSSRMFCCRL